MDFVKSWEEYMEYVYMSLDIDELGIPGGKPGMPYGFVRIFFILIFFYSSAAKVSGW